MMICQRCTCRLALFPRSTYPTFRQLSTTPTRPASRNPPPATSTSAAQPFSTPFTPSPSKTPTINTESSTKSEAPAPKSSVPAGTPLKGLGFTKGQEALLAKEDHEYPSWLWELLGSGTSNKEAEENLGDEFGRYPSAVQANKALLNLIGGALYVLFDVYC